MSAVSLLDLSTVTDNKGKNYYYYEVLTRTGECSDSSDGQICNTAAASRTDLQGAELGWG